MSQLISVLMPAKNAEKTIAKSVNSVLFQLQRNDELLVLDDQSQDATLKILKSIPDSRLRVIEAQKSLGVAEATNALLSNAKFGSVIGL